MPDLPDYDKLALKIRQEQMISGKFTILLHNSGHKYLMSYFLTYESNPFN